MAAAEGARRETGNAVGEAAAFIHSVWETGDKKICRPVGICNSPGDRQSFLGLRWSWRRRYKVVKI